MRQANSLELPIPYVKITIGLLVTVIAMFLLNLIAIYFKIYQGYDNFLVNMIYYYFNAALEESAQTLFSTLQLLFASAIGLLTGLILDKKDITKKYWIGLAIAFFYLALDESLMIHEQFNKLRPVVNDQSGFLYFTWVLPYAGLVIITGLFFFRFLLVLPRSTRNLFVLSGAVYVGAAIGFELMEGYITHNGGIGTYGDVFLPVIEELFEMCAITLFIYASLRHAKTLQTNVKLSLV